MENIKNDLFEFEVGTDGIGILSINQVNNPTNLFSTEFITSYIELANKVVADKEIKGMILTSGRSMFMPGADLRELQTMGDDPQKRLMVPCKCINRCVLLKQQANLLLLP